MANEATITIRIPSFLKVQVETARAGLGMTLSGYMRRALEEFLQPKPRTFEVPGMTEGFDQFVEDAKASCAAVILIVNDRNGNRTFFEGYLDESKETSSTMVFIAGRGKGYSVRPVLRADIFAWESGSAAEMDQLAVDFSHAGWLPQFPLLEGILSWAKTR